MVLLFRKFGVYAKDNDSYKELKLLRFISVNLIIHNCTVFGAITNFNHVSNKHMIIKKNNNNNLIKRKIGTCNTNKTIYCLITNNRLLNSY